MTNRLSTVLYFATWTALLAAPALLVGLIVTGYFNPATILAAFPNVPVAAEQSADTIICAGVVGLLPWIFSGWVLYQAQALFALYRHGLALTRQAAGRIFNLGIGLALVAVASVLSRSLQILILTSANTDGTRMLAVSFGFSHVALLLAAGLMGVVGRSMSEAADAVEDLRGIV